MTNNILAANIFHKENMMKKIISILTVICIICTASAMLSACGKKNKIVINAGEKILALFENCMSVDEILKDVSKVDFYHEMNKEGLTCVTEKDDENSTAIAYYKDKNGDTVYEEYIGYGEEGFVYHTKSKSGKSISVHYVYGYQEQRDVFIKAEDYSIRFYRTNDKSPYGAEAIEATVKGKKEGLLQESITYLCDNGDWTASANYLADDGMHSYTKWKADDYEEYDYVIFDKKENVKPMDIKPMLAYFGDTPYQLEMKMYSTPFYTEKDGETKWYFDGDLTFVFNTKEEADSFGKKFNGESDENDGIYYVCIENTGLPVTDEMKDFDPFDYYDINDAYSVVPEFNGEYEITSLSRGSVSYY